MKRRWQVGVVGTAGVACLALAAGAQEGAPAGSLPLRDVVLFSSGVGYFQRSGEIRGRTTVPLSFRTEQVNDILKSLVLLDPAGSVRSVTYNLPGGPIAGSRIRQNLNPNLTMGALLRQFQGARVRLELGGEMVEGRLVSISARTATSKEGVVQQDVANVLTEGGLRAVSLEGVTQVKLLDERLDRELRETLEGLAKGLDDQRQPVNLEFAGDGARQVRAGYLQESPVWKTSYRLVLDEGQKPYLQGWSIVENTTDEDWKDVRLSLVSGRPISFIQDLYQPLFVPRPEVETQVAGAPRPQLYGETLTRAEPAPAPGLGGGGFGGMAGGIPLLKRGVVGAGEDADGVPETQVTMSFRNTPLREALQRLLGDAGVQHSVDPNVPDVPVTVRFVNTPVHAALRSLIREAAVKSPGLTSAREGDIVIVKIRPGVTAPPPLLDDSGKSAPSARELALSVSALADGLERGALFQYAVKQPVTIARNQAAMVPIISGAVDGAAVSIYSPDRDPARVLNGFRLENNTSLHLSGGPITVLRDGSYAGDAQITNLQPGEDRLLAYAVDLDLVPDLKDPAPVETLTVSIQSGVMTIKRKRRWNETITFRNKSTKTKSVLVERDVLENRTVVEPAAFETTPATHRFMIEVPAGKTAELKLAMESPLTEELRVLNVSTDRLLQYVSNGSLSPKLKAGLQQLIGFRKRVAELQAERAVLEAEIVTIDAEQTRIRQNMAALERESPLYKQYVAKLTEQEARIEKLRAEIARLQAAENAALKEAQAFAESLTSE